MKSLLIITMFIYGSFSQAQAVAPAAANACEGVRVVEFRNSILAASLDCQRDLSDADYNSFITKNRDEIAAANNVAVNFFMARDKSRKRFDKLDSVTMNHVSFNAVNDKTFCDQIWYFKLKLADQTLDEALASQTVFNLPACGQY